MLEEGKFMQNQEMKMIIRIMGIIAVIFCLLALVLPWGTYVYTWGFSTPYMTSPFYIDLFTQVASAESIFFAIAMIIIFILTLITLILGIISVIKINKGFKYMFLTLGIICIFEFIFYIVAVSIVSGSYAPFTDYGIGFIFILITGILFIVSYVMQIVFGLQPKSRFQQMMGQQPIYQQPTPVQTPTQPELQQQPPAPKKQTKKSINFCPDCGNQLKPGAKFCPNCGSKIS
jgi:hypothetical protein